MNLSLKKISVVHLMRGKTVYDISSHLQVRFKVVHRKYTPF